MTPRQIKIHTGAGSGSFVTDSLGNTWLAGDSFNIGGVIKTECYYIPSGSGNTVAGTLTWRGITLDRPVLAKAFVFAIVFYRFSGSLAEVRTILVEFGIREDTFAYDYNSAGAAIGQNGTTPYPTNHVFVGWTTPTSGIPKATFSPVTVNQLWIAIRQLYNTPTSGSAPPYNPTAPADFTSIYDDGMDGVYYRFDTSGPADYTVPYTVSPGTVSGNLLNRFQNVSTAGIPLNVIPAAVPLAPQAPCNPQAQISGGGKGLFGCNVGGVGWVSQYSGPYGSVPQHTDPVDGETLTGKAGVDLWIELIHTAQDGTQTTYRRSLVELGDLSTYEGGRKTEGLKTIGAIDHGFSNEQGSYTASTVSIGYADMVDRLFRVLHETEDLEYDTIILKMASSAGRAASAAPRVLQRAVVQTPELQSQMDAILTAVDALFADFGPFGPNRQWPNPIPQLVGFTTPADVLAEPMPWIYGEKSDEGATDPKTNAPISKGLIPLKFLGQESISRTVLQPDTATQPPYDATVGGITGAGVLGQVGSGWSGPINTDPFFAIAPILNGKMGPLVLKGVSGRYDATPHNFRPVWNVDTPADQYYVFMYDRDTAWDANTNPYVAANPYYKIVSGTASNPYPDWQFFVDFTSRTDGTPWPPAPLAGGPVTIEDVWDVYLLAAHPIFIVLGLYGSDQAATTVDTSATGTSSTTATMSPDRAKLDIDSRGDVLVPGYANWPFATTYREYVGVDGKTYWLTVILAKGPLSDNHKNGVITLAANVIGVEDVGDGSGLPLIDAGPVEQHWRENALLNDWTSGLWCSHAVSPVTYPQWEDGTPKVRSSSFRDWQAFTATAYGGRGLTVGWAPDTIQSVSEWEKEWIRLESRTGINGHGQIVKWWLDETQDPTTWPAIDHVTRVFGPVKRSVGLERQNTVIGSGDWDPDASRFRMGPATYASATGIARYKGHTKSGDPVNSTILNDPTQFAWVLNRRLSRLQYGAAQIELEGDLGLLDYDVGSGIQFTSIEGTGTSGYVDRPGTILRRKINLDKQPITVTYTLLDMRDLLIATRVTGGLTRRWLASNDSSIAPVASNDDTVAPLALA